MTTYEAGEKAFKNGLPKKSNPFPEGTKDGRTWDEGWLREQIEAWKKPKQERTEDERK